jgi:hypothetical protein
MRGRYEGAATLTTLAMAVIRKRSVANSRSCGRAKALREAQALLD